MNGEPDSSGKSLESSKSGKIGPPQTPLRAKLLLLLASVAFALALAEVGLRIAFHNTLALVQDERSLVYRYDPLLGWFPVAARSNRFVGSRPITVVNNSRGFRGPEYAPNDKPGIMFLGDSFVWGFDAEAVERFTDRLQAKHPEWNVYNVGVSGYGTDQEFLLLQRCFDSFKPHVVFLVLSSETDEADNRANVLYGYYKPYYLVEQNNLRLQGVPVPRGERVFWAEHGPLSHSFLARLVIRSYFKVTSPPALHNPSPTGLIIRDMRQYVESHGATFVMGVTSGTPTSDQVLSHFKIPFVDLNTPLRYPEKGNHWTPEGNKFVCDKIEEFLLKGNYLGNGPAPR
ncbi:MAG TPA: SGNH/GDSL hydrolase family protein [Candidatus Acidoferrum sp.]|jgi:hypothetical protein|nr:SGNH/GDSL hydrolase family protein [Candidatus Acidoferrum sp.]